MASSVSGPPEDIHSHSSPPNDQKVPEGSNSDEGEWVDEIAARAAAQNQQYLELMETPPFAHAAAIARDNPIDADFAVYRQTLLSHGLADEVPMTREFARRAEARRREIEFCGTVQARPACAETVRYIYQVLRGHSPEQVFAGN